MNWGLKLDIFRDPRDYIFGASSVPRIPYRPDGNWEDYLPKYEPQAENYETSGCTVWGALNQLEILHKYLYGTEPNYSERFTYILAGVNPSYGGDPNRAYESIRKDGVIDQEYLPVPATLAEFLTPKPMDKGNEVRGQRWLNMYEYKHEWVWYTPSASPEDRITRLKEALQYSPLGVSVSAWYLKDGKYVDNNRQNNHWCVLYKIDDQGMWVFDSYDHSKKCLALDHKITRVKRIYINKKTVRALRKHKSILEAILVRLRMKKTLLDYCMEALGTDVTPDDLVPDRVACAITASTLIHKVDSTFPKVSGTWTMYDILEHRTDYARVTDLLPETIVISPTGLGNPGTNGHVGIALEHGLIASNDSATGQFTANYTLDSWKARYGAMGYPVLMYRKR